MSFPILKGKMVCIAINEHEQADGAGKTYFEVIVVGDGTVHREITEPVLEPSRDFILGETFKKIGKAMTEDHHGS